MKQLTHWKEFSKKIARAHGQFLEQQKVIFLKFLTIETTLLHETNRFDYPVQSPKSQIQFTYEQLVIHATGNISDVFGAKFQSQDQLKKRVRMPAPPFLLVDRVLTLHGDPLNQTLVNTITTETDLASDTWYLHERHIPIGFLLEASHAHLLLISWLGFDFELQGKKVLRLLGGTFKTFGESPKMGDTLKYSIRIYRPDSETNHLLGLEYDCYVKNELKLSVKDAKLGFFNEAELTSSTGILWSPEKINMNTRTVPSSPLVKLTHSSFSRKAIEAFANGDLFTCFGPGFEKGQTHTNSPRIQNGRMLLLNEIQEFDTQGGPWQRGYIRATQIISPDDWFFQCHFINDPVMPGLLSIEAFIQTMAFYLAGLGYTLDKDGWRFEIVPDVEYTFLARGQVVPTTRGVTYEVFVEEVQTAPYPTLFASLLATTFEGMKIYQLSHIGLRLVPDSPLSRHPELYSAEDQSSNAIVDPDGIILNYRTLLEFAIGNPSQAFGKKYIPYDQGMKMPRMPAPPFQFVTRVVYLKGEKGAFLPGAIAHLEYDIPPSAWYFHENGNNIMPLCVLLEALLQASGWFGVYIGTVLKTNEDCFIRNLNGTLKIFKALSPDSGSIRTEVFVENISAAGDMYIENFNLKCFNKNDLVCEGDSVFGFFNSESLEHQVGLKITDADLSLLRLPANVDINFHSYLEKDARALLPRNRLVMLDRITGFWPEAGAAHLGLLRAEKDVHPSDWFFKAHFYRDPVQPGSLGLESMLLLLKFYLLEQTCWQRFAEPIIEAPALGSVLDWRYRGQVLTIHDRMICTMEITSLVKKTHSLLATAHASLWVANKRIYEADFAVRLRDKAAD